MPRLAFLALPGLAFATILFLGAGTAHAEQSPPAGDAVAAEPSPLPSSTLAVGGVHLLATAGIGASVNDVRQLDLAPYGPSVGLDAGYTFGFGLHLGAYFNSSFGQTTTKQVDPRLGANFDLSADCSSLNTGIAVGYAIPIHFLILRYSLGLGITSMSWDFGTVDPRRVRYDDQSNPNVGFHLAPGVALLWPYGLFEGGLGFDYLIQVDPTIPSGFLGKVLVGVKL
jgi:hypothetical protein